MNEGKEDYRRYNVLSTMYNVPSIRDGIRESGALRIPTSYLNILRSIFDISLVAVSRISYFVLGTVLEFPLLHSSISVQSSILSAAADK